MKQERVQARERYPRVLPDELDAAGLALRTAIVSGPRSGVPGQFPIEASDGSLDGPFGLFLFAPGVGAPLQELGAALRRGTSLSDRERELATLAVAFAAGSAVEVQAHVPLAHAAGIDGATISSLREGKRLADSREQALAGFCRAAVVEVRPRAAFAALAEVFDRRAVMEVLALVAYYRGLAAMLELCEISLRT